MGLKFFLGPNKFWVQKIFGSKRNVRSNKNFSPKKFWVLKDYGSKMFCVKKISGLKNLDSENNKILFNPFTNFGSQKIWVRIKFWLQKKFLLGSFCSSRSVRLGQLG